MYYLNSRYYVPEWGRFFSSDIVMNTTGDLNGYNLYAYAGNNPVVNEDGTGFIVETALDVASAGYSAYELWKNPSWLNLGMLAWDIAAIIVPVMPGSYALKATKTVINAVDATSDTAKEIKVIGRLEDTAIAKDWAGYDVLDIPDWSLIKNDLWVNEGIKNRQTFYIASPMTSENLISRNLLYPGPTVFAREIAMLQNAGYVRIGDNFVPMTK